MTIADILFGCWHSDFSFPRTAKIGSRIKAAQVTGTYVVCLDCGKEFPYDWKQMKVVSETRTPVKSLAEFGEIR